MTTRTNNGCFRVSSTDLLIAMLSSDLRGSCSDEGHGNRSRDPVDPIDPIDPIDPAASSPLPVLSDADDPEDRDR